MSDEALRLSKGWKRKHCVAELIALGMVKTVGMIEREMGYRAANPFTIRIGIDGKTSMTKRWSVKVLFSFYYLGLRDSLATYGKPTKAVLQRSFYGEMEGF
jgi:hypothetical protein